jgi:hypothetical protein
MTADKRLDVKLALEITDNGTPFSSNTTTWEDVPREGVLKIQQEMIGFLTRMTEYGAQWAAEIANPTV